MKRKKASKRGIALCLLIGLLGGGMPSAVQVQAAVGETVTDKKTGREIVYEIQAEGTVSGQERSVSVAEIKGITTEEQIKIPAQAYIYDGWEKTRIFNVTGIKPGVFSGCSGMKKVYIEGGVTLPAGALDGLPADVLFETADLGTKKALLEYGIPESRITYQGIKSNYVVFGDSIAAGYALKEYSDYGKVNGLAVGDAYPTPAEAFPSLFVKELEDTRYGNLSPVSLHNFAVSGTTSQQLLDQLNRGDYDGALANADIISVTIGSNDLLGPFMDIVKETVNTYLTEKGMEFSLILGKDYITIGALDAVINEIPGLIDRLNTVLVNNSTLNAACDNFKNNTYPAILAKLEELAPDAHIYWTDFYNPYSKQKLDMEELFPNMVALADDPTAFHPLELGNLADEYIRKMNGAFDLRQDTEKYHRVSIYWEFEQPGLTNAVIKEDGGNARLNLDPHPNAVGHRRIASDLRQRSVEQGNYQPNDPLPDQSGEMEFLSFKAGGVQGSINEAERKITLELPAGTDVSRLAPEFAVSDKTKVYVGQTLQTSGVTANDFTSPVVYTVEAEIGARKNYQVEIRFGAPAGKDPGSTGKPDSGKTPASDKKGTINAVKTGDEASVMRYIILLAASAFLAAGIVYRQKRKKRG